MDRAEVRQTRVSLSWSSVASIVLNPGCTLSRWPSIRKLLRNKLLFPSPAVRPLLGGGSVLAQDPLTTRDLRHVFVEFRLTDSQSTGLYNPGRLLWCLD